MQDQIIAVYKPKGPTSHDIINKIRKITGVKKVGHAGTLDPFAEGVLVVGIGRGATKKLSDAVKKEKEYVAEIYLGARSTTDDAEGQKTFVKVEKIPSQSEIKSILKKFVGIIEQVPPQYSAVKIQGKESYKWARKGKKMDLSARKAEIKKIQVLKYHWPYLSLRVVTGPGVYIRALARDIGEDLRVGGYLLELERTRVGEWRKDAAIRDFDKIAILMAQ